MESWHSMNRLCQVRSTSALIILDVSSFLASGLLMMDLC